MDVVLGEMIRDRRTEQGAEIGDIAFVAGLSPGEMAKVEAGELSLPSIALRDVADAIALDLDELADAVVDEAERRIAHDSSSIADAMPEARALAECAGVADGLDVPHGVLASLSAPQLILVAKALGLSLAETL